MNYDPDQFKIDQHGRLVPLNPPGPRGGGKTAFMEAQKNSATLAPDRLESDAVQLAKQKELDKHFPRGRGSTFTKSPKSAFKQRRKNQRR